MCLRNPHTGMFHLLRQSGEPNPADAPAAAGGGPADGQRPWPHRPGGQQEALQFTLQPKRAYAFDGTVVPQMVAAMHCAVYALGVKADPVSSNADGNARNPQIEDLNSPEAT